MTLHRGDPIDLDPSDNGATPKGRRLGTVGGPLGRTTGGVVRTGVLIDGMAAVVSGSGAGMSYNVRACAVVAKHSDANGPTISALDATENIAEADAGSPGGTSLAAPGSNSRIDVIYAVQDLITSDGGATVGGAQVNTFRVGVRKGTEAASPSIPSIADVPGAVALARATVPSSATTTSGLTFTQMHDWCTANGGLIPTAKGSRKFTAWNGTEMMPVNAGIDVQGASETNKAASFVKAGVSTVALNAGGDGEIIFDTAFPSAIINAQLTDATGGLGAIILKYTSGTSSATRITLRGYDQAGSPLASQNIAVSWTAIGR